jgi:hypothetical protein
MRFSTLSAHTTRTCDTPFRTTGTSRTLSGMADHSSRYRLPLPEESLPSQASLNSREEVVGDRYPLGPNEVYSLHRPTD